MNTDIIVLHNTKRGNNYTVARIIAEHLDCPIAAAEDTPDVKDFSAIVFVVPNAGDEEIAQPMENYLIGMDKRIKRYAICELGNYFGLDSYVGCSKVIRRFLKDWTHKTTLSLDSLPEIDYERLDRWLNEELSVEQLLESSLNL